MSTKYWHVMYEVSGKPPQLAVGDRAHHLDIGFSSYASSFPIEEARQSIGALYRNTKMIRHNFMLTAIVSWTDIDEPQYASLSANNNTAKTTGEGVKELRRTNKK